MSVRLSLVLALVAVSAASPAFAAPPSLPQLPGSSPDAKDKDGKGGAPVVIDLEALRKGIVQVEQQGRPIGIGTVLAKDGRIVTALSALGAGETADIRYADGSVVKGKLGHKDKGWDLALLVPQTGKWLDGLTPSMEDPANVELKSFLPKAGKLGASGIGFKSRIDARSKEGDPLKSVLDLDLKGLPTIPGAPILDPSGRVVGVLVKACKDAGEAKKDDAKDAKPAACSPITIAAPVYALRGFLQKTPATAVAPQPWLGLGGAPTEQGNVKGVRVMGLAPGSPAEKAGLKAGGDNPDTIVAVDGQPVETPEQLAKVISERAIGQTVKLLVFSQGKFRETQVTLRSAP